MVRKAWNKNLKMSNDFCDKVKRGMAEKNASKKISQKMKGDKNPAKRKDVRKKNSDARKKSWKNKLYREKQIKSHSLNSKKTWQNGDIRERRIKGIRNFYNSKKGKNAKKKLSESAKKYWSNPDYRKRVSNSIRNTMNDKEFLEKRRNISKKLWKRNDFRKKQQKTYEIKEKISQGTKIGMNDKDVRKKCSNGGISQRGIPKPALKEETKRKIREARSKQVFPLKDSTIEVKIQNFLNKLNIKFSPHKYMNINHAYQCDIYIPSKNLIIECDGDYWHNYPVGRDIDHIRTKELQEKGFRVLRLWEFEINDMTLNKFQKIICKNGTK